MASEPSTSMEALDRVAERIEEAAGGYTGGPRGSFEAAGRDALLALLESGLLPSHKVLDFGCGALRVGYWLVRFLDPNCYCGIDRERKVEIGKRFALTPELLAFKAPRFDDNRDCDMSVFGERFDFVLARSIFTHMAPGLVRKSLASFRENSPPSGVLLASYYRAEDELHWLGQWVNAATRIEIGDELPDDDLGFRPVVKYSLEYMARLADQGGLQVEELTSRSPINDQVWLRFEHVP
jgi:SAM-dependent methyltransferase